MVGVCVVCFVERSGVGVVMVAMTRLWWDAVMWGRVWGGGESGRRFGD